MFHIANDKLEVDFPESPKNQGNCEAPEGDVETGCLHPTGSNLCKA